MLISNTSFSYKKACNQSLCGSRPRDLRNKNRKCRYIAYDFQASSLPLSCTSSQNYGKKSGNYLQSGLPFHHTHYTRIHICGRSACSNRLCGAFLPFSARANPKLGLFLHLGARSYETPSAEKYSHGRTKHSSRPYLCLTG